MLDVYLRISWRYRFHSWGLNLEIRIKCNLSFRWSNFSTKKTNAVQAAIFNDNVHLPFDHCSWHHRRENTLTSACVSYLGHSSLLVGNLFSCFSLENCNDGSNLTLPRTFSGLNGHKPAASNPFTMVDSRTQEIHDSWNTWENSCFVTCNQGFGHSNCYRLFPKLSSKAYRSWHWAGCVKCEECGGRQLLQQNVIFLTKDQSIQINMWRMTGRIATFLEKWLTTTILHWSILTENDQNMPQELNYA